MELHKRLCSISPTSLYSKLGQYKLSTHEANILYKVWSHFDWDKESLLNTRHESEWAFGWQKYLWPGSTDGTWCPKSGSILFKEIHPNRAPRSLWLGEGTWALPLMSKWLGTAKASSSSAKRTWCSKTCPSLTRASSGRNTWDYKCTPLFGSAEMLKKSLPWRGTAGLEAVS